MQNTVFKTGATLLVLLIGVYATVACLRLLRPREEIGILLVTPAKLGMYFREVAERAEMAMLRVIDPLMAFTYQRALHHTLPRRQLTQPCENVWSGP